MSLFRTQAERLDYLIKALADDSFVEDEGWHRAAGAYA